MKWILACFALALLPAAVMAQGAPAITELETPYAPLPHSVTFMGVQFGPGTVAYGPVGTPVIVRGTNFGSAPGSVQFGTVAAAPSSWSSTAITVAVPSGSVTSYVTVTTGGGTSNTLPFAVMAGSYGSSCPTGPPALTVTTLTLPQGGVGVPYSVSLGASGGQSPYTWSIVGGALPSGLTLNASTGVISGTPSAGGTSSFTAEVTDVNGNVASVALSITVEAGCIIARADWPLGIVFGHSAASAWR